MDGEDELTGILEDVARLRGCYPLVNRVESQFMEYLLTHHRNYLIPIAEQFYTHCVDTYGVDNHDDK